MQWFQLNNCPISGSAAAQVNGQEWVASACIDIGQLWLPPVADDESVAEFGRLANDENLLANRFRGEGGDRAYRAYVAAKERRRATLSAIDTALDRLSGGADGPEDRLHDALNIADGDLGSADRLVDEWRLRSQTEVNHAYSIVGRRGCEDVPDADVVREGTRFGYVLARLHIHLSHS